MGTFTMDPLFSIYISIFQKSHSEDIDIKKQHLKKFQDYEIRMIITWTVYTIKKMMIVSSYFLRNQILTFEQLQNQKHYFKLPPTNFKCPDLILLPLLSIPMPNCSTDSI